MFRLAKLALSIGLSCCSNMNHLSIWAVVCCQFIFVGCSKELYGTSSLNKLAKPYVVTEITPDFEPLRLNLLSILPLREDVQDRQPQVDKDLQLSRMLATALELHSSVTVFEGKNSIFERKTMFNAGTSGVSSTTYFPALVMMALRQARIEGSDGTVFGIYKVSGINGAKKAEGLGVSFTLWLLDSLKGKVVWTAKYSRQNQALSDNIFKAPHAIMSRDFRYLSIDELFNRGFEMAANALEKSRKEALMPKEGMIPVGKNGEVSGGLSK